MVTRQHVCPRDGDVGMSLNFVAEQDLDDSGYRFSCEFSRFLSFVYCILLSSCTIKNFCIAVCSQTVGVCPQLRVSIKGVM